MPATALSTATTALPISSQPRNQQYIAAPLSEQAQFLNQPSRPQNLPSEAMELQDAENRYAGSLQAIPQHSSSILSSAAGETHLSGETYDRECLINRKRTPPRRRNTDADAQEIARILRM